MACKHARERGLVQRSVKTLSDLVTEMYERYERERLAGFRSSALDTPQWRSVVRWEVKRHRRENP